MQTDEGRCLLVYVFQDVNVDLFDLLTFNGFENRRNFDQVKSFLVIHKGDAEGYVVFRGFSISWGMACRWSVVE